MKTTAVIIVLALLVGSLGALAAINDNGANTVNNTTTTLPKAEPVPAGQTIAGDTPCPATDGSSPRASSFEKAPKMCIDPKKKYTATFDTTEGTIVVDLDTARTPNTTNNFVVLARYHYYDGSAIFRTDPSIDIIQGGGPSTQDNSDPGPGYTITDEGVPFTYKEGDLVMANTGNPNTSGAQFFFATGPNVAGLDGQGSYLNFGKTVQGVDVLKKIIGLHVDTGGNLGGTPSRSVIVNKVTIEEK